MTGASSSHASVRERSGLTGPGPFLARRFQFALAVVAETRRAAAAARRFDELRRIPRTIGDPAASPARRIFVEFYSDGP
jgi:hypothetical protein